MKKLLPVLCALTFLLPATGLSQNKNQRAKEAMERRNAAEAEALAKDVKNANPQIQGQSGSDLFHAVGYSNAGANAANAGNSEAAYDNTRRAWTDTPEARKKSASTSGGDWTSKISPRDIDNDPGLSSQQKDDLKKALNDARKVSDWITQDKKELESNKKYIKDLELQKANLSSDPRADLTTFDKLIDKTKAENAQLEKSIKSNQKTLDNIKKRFRACTNCKPAHQ